MINNAVTNILEFAHMGDSGKNWYFDAHEFSQKLGALYDKPLYTIAGMIAALSPQNKWDSNKQDVINLLEAAHSGYDVFGVKVSTFNPNKAKAIFILWGDNPLNVLGGLKTRSFYQNILNPNNSDYVTIDRHAVSIALGERVTNMTKIGYYVSTPKRYAIMQEYYTQAAKLADVLPCQIQAMSWVNYRNVYQVV